MNEKIHTINSITPSIGYEGVVSIKIKKGNKTIKTICSHNNGTSKLFSFIQYCLQGGFEQAKSSRPCKLLLLKQGTNKIVDGKTLKDEELSTPEDADYGANFWGSDHIIAPGIIYNKVPVIGNDDKNGHFIKYSFRIPVSILDSNSEIYKLALVPELYNNEYLDICAYYRLTEPIVVSSLTSDHVLNVEWTLRFKNISGGTE